MGCQGVLQEGGSPSSLEKVVLQPPVPACFPDLVPTGRRGRLPASQPRDLPEASRGQGEGLWRGWVLGENALSWIPVTAETYVEFTEFSPALQVKRPDPGRSRGGGPALPETSQLCFFHLCSEAAKTRGEGGGDQAKKRTCPAGWQGPISAA